MSPYKSLKLFLTMYKIFALLY